MLTCLVGIETLQSLITQLMLTIHITETDVKVSSLPMVLRKDQ